MQSPLLCGEVLEENEIEDVVVFPPPPVPSAFQGVESRCGVYLEEGWDLFSRLSPVGNAGRVASAWKNCSSSVAIF